MVMTGVSVYALTQECVLLVYFGSCEFLFLVLTRFMLGLDVPPI